MGRVINWVVATMVLLFAPYVIAQNGTIPPPPLPPPLPPVGYTYNPKIKIKTSLAIVLVCLISAFMITGCVSVYVAPFFERRRGFDTNRFRRTRLAVARGLDPSVVDSFPTFLYSDVKGIKIGKGALECAVCLNEFSDEETLRLLPKCNHVFHPDCIDVWLASRVTCPVCRAYLVPRPGELGPITILSHDPDNDPFESTRSPEIDDSAPVNADDSIIDIRSPEVINPIRTPNQNRPPRASPKKWHFTGKFPRSHSTGHLVVQPGEDHQRFTLRLPDEIRSRLVNSSLSWNKSSVAFPRVRSSRKGFRSSSVGTGRGKNHEYYERWGFTLTPPFISRAGSSSSGAGVLGDDATGTPNTKFRSVKPPFDRLFGRRDKHRGNDIDDDGGNSRLIS